jgi:transcriptional regulator with PAS, ATPase and Fis domain
MIAWQPGMTLEDMEKQIILKAFRFFNKNKTQTAKSLGIAIRTLDAKLDKYNRKVAG